MKIRTWAKLIIPGLVFALPLAVQAVEYEHGETEDISTKHEEHGGGDVEKHGEHSKSAEHEGGHGKENAGHGGDKRTEGQEGHSESAEHGGGDHGGHLYTAATTDSIGNIALSFIAIVLVALAIGIYSENKKHHGDAHGDHGDDHDAHGEHDNHQGHEKV